MGRHMQVFVRLFPLPNRDWRYIEVSKDFKDVFLQCKEEKNPVNGVKRDNYIKFHTSGVLVNCSQEEFYKTISQDLITKLFNGENVIVMATGQHDSGKSFSMTAYCGSYENRGFSLRFVDDLFLEMGLKQNLFKTELFMSYVDFSAQSIIDLLNEPATCIFHLNQIKKVKVKTKEDLMKTILLAEKRRLIEGISSHCATGVLTFYLKVTSKVKSEPYDYFPTIHLVELCGPESTSRATSCQAKSNRDIADMSIYLASSKTVSICRSPSKLVSFLSNTWNNSFIRIVCHLKPLVEKWHHNLSTLMFANRLMRHTNMPICLQRSENPVKTLQYALDTVQTLEDEFLVREMVQGEGFRNPDIISQKQMDYIFATCTKFLEGEMTIESLLSNAHPVILLKTLKKYFEMMKKSETKYDNSLNTSLSTASKLDKMSSQKLSFVLKKKGLSARQENRNRNATMDTSDSNNIQKLSLEGDGITPPQGMPDKKTIEAEFFIRYPEVKARLDVIQQNYSESIRIRDETMAEFDRLKKEAQEERQLEEDHTWKRRLEMGESVGIDGRMVWSKPEETPTQDAALIARREAAEAISAFVNARDALTDIKSAINAKIQNYMSTAYGLYMPSIDQDELRYCYNEQTDVLSDLQEKQNPTINDIRMRDIFYRMQGTHNKSNPFKNKKRWIN